MALNSKIFHEFAKDPSNADVAFKIANEYEKIKNYASAISFYLKIAESDEHKLNVYSALLKLSECLLQQQNRDSTVETSLFQAMHLMPERPEAYFLMSKICERKQEWQKCYTFASLGMHHSTVKLPTPVDVGYTDYALKFQLGLSAWWIGRKQESKQLMEELYYSITDPVYLTAIKNNLQFMGVNLAADIDVMSKRVNSIKSLLALESAYIKYERFGSPGDGGYVLANDLSSDDFLVSFGVGDNIDFEAYLYKNFGIYSHMYDHTVENLPQEIPGSLHFKEEVGNDADIKSAIKRAPNNKDYILKMDIEGSEFAVLANSSSSDLNCFRQIVMEVHWMDKLYDESFYRLVLAAFTNLRKSHFPVMVHPNNDRQLLVIGNSPVPVVFEILWLNRSVYTFNNKYDPFEGLLSKNLEGMPEIGLSFP